MDDRRFDALARTVAAGTGSRRGALRLLTGGILGALAGALGAAGTGVAQTDCRRPGASCRTPDQCCSRQCSPEGVCLCTAADQCPKPRNPCRKARCARGNCGVVNKPAGTACDDRIACTGLGTCSAGGTCQPGAPDDARCPAANPCLVGRCEPANPSRDARGCVFTPVSGGTISCGTGACAREVAACVDGRPQECVPGQPSAEVCNGIDDDCDGVVDNGATCTGGKTCQDGACACPQGQTECGGVCVDTGTNPSHCGACDVPCDGGTGTCRGGRCARPEACNGADDDLDGVVDDGAACPHNQVCLDGRCGCPAGTQDCDGNGVCEDLQTNDRFCGDCATACTGGKTCQGGVCRCPAGQKDCGGTCFSEASCCPGTTRPCYTGPAGTEGVGTCRTGTQTCGQDGAWGGCAGEVVPTADTCNGLDEDCDGVPDDEASCPAGKGCVGGRCVCPSGQKDCDGTCIATASCCTTADCGTGGKVCPSPGGTCECPQDTTLCGTRCVDTTADRDNCGGCGRGCASGAICCNGTCADLQTSTTNCGACGNACPASTSVSCVGGVCRCRLAGDNRFDGLICGGRCVDPTRDNANCGACGNVCPSGTGCGGDGGCCPRDLISCGGTCVDPRIDESNCGTCGVVCPTGTACCPSRDRGVCTNTATSPNNCGACGIRCNSGTGVCRNGVCIGCATGRTDCGGLCLDLATNHDNCGACGNACPSDATCQGGTCVCPSGLSACRGVDTCRNLATDPAHCGTCDHACATGQTCCGGTCCAAGQTCCGGVCKNLQTDPANCNACGRVCPAPTNGAATCAGGVCGFTCNTNYKPCGTGCIPSANCCTDADCGEGGICTGTGRCCLEPCGDVCCPLRSQCNPDTGECEPIDICTNPDLCE